MKSLRLLLFALFAATATPVLAFDTPTTATMPDLSAIRTKIDAKDYRGAITDLNKLINRGVQDADVYNLMGYSLRKSGDTQTAMTFYKKALEFDPNHKGALEYSGELYVQIGDLAKARQNEVRLMELCPQGCEELSDLQEAIGEAPAK